MGHLQFKLQRINNENDYHHESRCAFRDYFPSRASSPWGNGYDSWNQQPRRKQVTSTLSSVRLRNTFCTSTSDSINEKLYVIRTSHHGDMKRNLHCHFITVVHSLWRSECCKIDS